MAVASSVESIGARARVREERRGHAVRYGRTQIELSIFRVVSSLVSSLCSPMKKEGKTCQKIAFLSIKCTCVCEWARTRKRLY